MSDTNKNLVMGHQDGLGALNLIFDFDWSMITDGCLTLRQTGRLTVSYNITLTLEDVADRHNKGR
jgi:hypothetical protein